MQVLAKRLVPGKPSARVAAYGKKSSAIMATYANLLHPIVCPMCGELRAQEIQFLEGLVAAEDPLDVRMGEAFSAPVSALSATFRTHGLSICPSCQQTVSSLIAVRDQRVIQLEVFPKASQEMLTTFPACLVLQSSSDEDMIALSGLLEEFGGTLVRKAVEEMAAREYSDDYWSKAGESAASKLVSKPVMDQLVEYLSSESAPSSDDLLDRLVKSLSGPAARSKAPAGGPTGKKKYAALKELARSLTS